MKLLKILLKIFGLEVGRPTRVIAGRRTIMSEQDFESV